MSGNSRTTVDEIIVALNAGEEMCPEWIEDIENYLESVDIRREQDLNTIIELHEERDADKISINTFENLHKECSEYSYRLLKWKVEAIMVLKKWDDVLKNLELHQH